MTINRKNLLSQHCQACCRVSAGGTPPQGKSSNAQFFLLVHVLDVFSGGRRKSWEVSSHGKKTWPKHNASPQNPKPKNYHKIEGLELIQCSPPLNLRSPFDICQALADKTSLVKVPKSNLIFFKSPNLYLLFIICLHIYFFFSVQIFQMIQETLADRAMTYSGSSDADCRETEDSWKTRQFGPMFSAFLFLSG